MSSYLEEDTYFWKKGITDIYDILDSSVNGLTNQIVRDRRLKYGINLIHKRRINLLLIIFRQISTNPLLIILASAAFISYFLGERISSIYILWMILLGVFLGFWNEYSAEKTIDNLLSKISPKTLVIRNGEKAEIPASECTLGYETY
jgi:Ca2+-transporting ATPase